MRPFFGKDAILNNHVTSKGIEVGSLDFHSICRYSIGSAGSCRGFRRNWRRFLHSRHHEGKKWRGGIQKGSKSLFITWVLACPSVSQFLSSVLAFKTYNWSQWSVKYIIWNAARVMLIKAWVEGASVLKQRVLFKKLPCYKRTHRSISIMLSQRLKLRMRRAHANSTWWRHKVPTRTRLSCILKPKASWKRPSRKLALTGSLSTVPQFWLVRIIC